MFTSLKVSGYRGLKSLEVERLGRVNLVAGRNNSGKTSLLEAVFLLAHGGSAQGAINSNVVRGGFGLRVTPDTNARARWVPLFHGLDTASQVSISGIHTDHGSLRLTIEHRYSTTFRTASSKRDTRLGAGGSPELHFSLSSAARKGRLSRHIRSRISFGPKGTEVKGDGEPLVIPCVILSSGAHNPEDDAQRLGQLRVRKQADLVVEALRTVEPSLLGLDIIPGPEGQALWGDVGLPQQVPLTTLGDGLNRMARIVLAIGHDRVPLVLVDEIENGFHHSVLDAVWKVVYETAERFDAQVIATTHSYECIRAAHDASPGHDLALHRLDAEDDGMIRCVTYDSESIEGAMHHGFEVR